jgi:hypothetical protein
LIKLQFPAADLPPLAQPSSPNVQQDLLQEQLVICAAHNRGAPLLQPPLLLRWMTSTSQGPKHLAAIPLPVEVDPMLQTVLPWACFAVYVKAINQQDSLPNSAVLICMARSP